MVHHGCAKTDTRARAVEGCAGGWCGYAPGRRLGPQTGVEAVAARSVIKCSTQLGIINCTVVMDTIVG